LFIVHNRDVYGLKNLFLVQIRKSHVEENCQYNWEHQRPEYGFPVPQKALEPVCEDMDKHHRSSSIP
jgi:hypothetical protein